MEKETSIFLDLEDIANAIDTALEKLDTANNEIFKECNELRAVEELKIIYAMAIKPIEIKSDIINDYANEIKELKTKLTEIIKQQLKGV